MKERLFEMTCPHCGHVFEIKRDTIIIAGMDTYAQTRLEDGSYFRHQCQMCFNVFDMVYPFLYKDKDFVLVLTNKDRIDNLPSGQVIYCRDVKQFILAYKIYSRHLNASLVLHKKALLEKKLHRSVSFSGFECGCLWFDQDIGVSLTDDELALILK